MDYADLGSGVSTGSLRVTLDGGDLTALARVYASSAVISPLEPLPEGRHEVMAAVSDRLGLSTSAASVFLVDSAAPVVAITTPVAGAMFSTSAPFIAMLFQDAGSGLDPASLTLSLDGSTVPARIETSTGVPVASASAVFQPTALAEGAHQVIASAVDRAGNPSAHSVGFTVDTLPPALSVTLEGAAVSASRSPPIRSRRPLFRLLFPDAVSGADLASLTVLLDNVDRTRELSLSSAAAVFASPSDLAEGFHELEASVKDRAGNPARLRGRFRVDSLAPRVAVDSPAAGGVISSRSPRVAASFTDPWAGPSESSAQSGLVLSSIRLSLDDSTSTAQVAFEQGAAGLPSTWTPQVPLPRGRFGHAVVALEDRIYVLGGSERGIGPSESVLYADIREGGEIAPWREGPKLPKPLSFHRAVSAGDSLFVLGGNADGILSRDVLYARPDPDRNLGPWLTAAPLPFPGQKGSFGAVAIGGFVYVLGSGNLDCSAPQPVFFARACPEGLCHPDNGNATAPWLETAALPPGTLRFDAAESEGRLLAHVPAGAAMGCANARQEALLESSPDPVSGRLSPWIAAQPVPPSRETQLLLVIAGHLYALGGLDASREPSPAVAYAPLLPGSSLGVWREPDDRRLPKALAFAEGAAWAGNLYVIGGIRAAGEAASDIYRSQVSTASILAATAALVPGFALAEGSHQVTASVLDVAGNTGSATATFTVDVSSPGVSIASPRGGERFVATVSTVEVGVSASDNLDPAPAIAATLAAVEDRGTPRGGRPDLVAVSTSQVLRPSDLDDGLWELRVTARDWAGNSTATVSGVFEIIHDVAPPRTAVAIGKPALPGGPGGSVFVSKETSINLASIDDLAAAGDSIGLGVVFQHLSVDAVPRSTFTNAAPAIGQVFSRTLTLSTDPDGLHVISAFAQDTLGIVEPARVSTVAVDNTAPVTALWLEGGDRFPGPDPASQYISTMTRIGFVASDPAVNGVASGLAATSWQDNGGDFQAFGSTFTLVEGAHALGYRSQDPLGNSEVLRSTTVLVDATAPRTTLAVIGGVQHPGLDGETFYASSATRYGFAPTDPHSGGVASGVGLTQYQDDRGPFASFADPFALPEGAHQLAYRSRDNVGNLEVPRSTNPWVDAAAPVSAYAIGKPYYLALNGARYVTPATPVTFSAADPPLSTGQPGSGFRRIETAIDGGSFAVYAAALVFTEGPHRVLYRSLDNVLNREETRTLEVISDDTAPELTFAFSLDPIIRPPANVPWFPADFKIIWSATDTASGVAFVETDTPVTQEGKGLKYAGSAADHVANVAFATATVNLDKTPPHVSAGEAFGVFEGQPAQFDATVTDTLDDAVRFAWAFGDGGTAGRELQPTHVYSDNGVFDAVLTATDHAGHVSTGSVRVTVMNAAPVVEAGQDQSPPEGSFVALSSTFSDAGRLDTHTATVDWGDGTVSSAAVIEADGAGAIAASHAYADDGVYAVTVTVKDNDGAVGQDSLRVTVTNVAPSLARLPDQAASEGGFIQLPPASFTDAGFNNPAGGTREDFTATIDWGDGTMEPAGDVALTKTPGGEGILTRGTIQAKHAYGDNGSYEVTVTVTDDDGGVSRSTFAVTVDNVAPILGSLPSLRTGEGSFIQFPPASFTDVGYLDTHTATIDWGDGTSEPAADIALLETVGGEGIVTRGTIQARHAYGDNGSYPVTLTVHDDDGGVATSTFTVTVGNVAPALASLPSLRAEEGSFIQLPPAAFTDPGFDNPAGGTREDFAATIDWGDGTTEPANDITLLETPGGEGRLTVGSVQARHAFGDNGSYAVTVTVKDDDGSVATSTFTVTVANVAPTLAELPSLRADEGSFILLPATFSDPGFDNSAAGTREDFTATIDWGDGTTEPLGDITLTKTSGSEGVLTRGTVEARHAYSDNGAYAVTVTVRDDDGGLATSTVTVTVDNVAPTLANLPALRADEGSFIQLPPATFTDPGFDNPAGGTREDFIAAIDWGDGTIEPAGDIALAKIPGSEGVVTRGTIQARHAYGDDGIYAVTVTVKDDDGGIAKSTFTVTVDNVAPTLAALPSLKNDEGSFIQLPPASFSDPGFDNTPGRTREDFTAMIDWGDGTAEPAGDITLAETPGGEGSLTSGSIQARHAYGDNGIYGVTVTVKDDDGGTAKSTFTVTVDNVAPTLAELPSLRADEGSFIELPPATFTDPGFDNAAPEDRAKATRETFTATVDWGDGTTEPVSDIELAEIPGFEGALTSGTIRARHAYGDDGVYTVSVTVSDDDGGRDSKSFQVTVQNVAPTMAELPDVFRQEGEFLELPPAAFSDPGFDHAPARTLEDFSATVDWGDGNTEPLADLRLTESPGGEGTLTRGRIEAKHAYGDNGLYTATVCVADDDGGRDCKSFRATVGNVAPTVAGLKDQVAVARGFFHIGAVVPVRTLEVQIPGQGASFVAIGSSAPVVTPPVRYLDPGFDNPPGRTLEDFAASIAWGDGAVSVEPEVLEGEASGSEGVPSSGTVFASRQYQANGIYAVTAEVLDDDGGLGRSSFTVTVDLVPPISTITLSGRVSREAAVPAEAQAFLGPAHTLDLSAYDPVVNNIAFGVQWSFRRDLAVVAATAPFTLTQVPFALAEEGLHRLEFFSVDRIGNEEEHLFVTLAVDHTAPVSALAVGMPSDTAFGLRLLSPDTPLSLSAEDPRAAAPGLFPVASGVRRIEYSVDNGATRTWDGTPIRLPLGTHTVAHWAADKVENAAAAVTETFHVLACPGKTLASLGTISLSGTVRAGAPDSPVQLCANGAFSAVGTSDVYGSVQAQSISKTGQAAVHGQETLSSAALPAAPIDLAPLVARYSIDNDNARITSHIDAAGVLNLASQATLELTTGVYFLNGLVVDGGASLVAKGKVQLLVNGPVKLGGSASVNAAGPSGNLYLFIAASTTMTVSGTVAAVARVYAPTSRLELGGGARLALCAYAREAELKGTSLALGAGDALPPALASSKGSKVAAASAVTGGPDGTFRLGEVYAFPNPAVAGQVPAIHVEVGLADAVTIKIFDAAGRPVRQGSVNGAPHVLDDGQGPQYAYEYRWQGHIPSGMYYYTIEASKGGHGKLQKAGRLAVVR